MRSRSGLTLIEITVAILLIAIMMAVAVPAFRQATDADLKGVAMSISGAARACFGEAAVKNVTLRLAYDLDHGQYWIEAYPGAFQVIGQERDLERARADEAKAKEDEARKKELEDRFGKSDSGESAKPVPQFVPVKLVFVEPQQLPRSVRFLGVRTPQFRQIVKSGMAYTHFFPNGWAERTLVYLEDSSGAKMTLEVEPLTGRVVLHDGQLDYRDLDDLHQKERS